MTLRFKSFVIAVSFIIILSVFFIVSYYFVFLSYSRNVEARFAEDSIERIHTSLNLEIKDFAYICSSYSDWIRTYKFVENPDFEYIEENLKESDFENFGFDFIAITDLKGNVLYADSYNYLLKLGLKSIIRKIFNHSKIKETAANLEETSGIIKIKNEAYIISFNTVKKYRDAPNPNGYFIAGKKLKNANIFKVRYDPDYLNFSLFEENSSVPDFNEIRSEILLNNMVVRQDSSSKELHVYFLIKDVSDKPTLLLTLYQKSDVSDISHKTTIFIIYTSVVVIFILISIFILIFERYVIKKIARLNKNIEIFLSADGQGNSLTEIGEKTMSATDDEIENLGRNVQKVLEKINYHYSKERLLTKIAKNFLKHDVQSFKAGPFIKDTLENVGGFIGADQVFILISDKKAKISCFKYRWNAAGIKDPLTEPDNFPIEKFKLLSDAINKEGIFLINSRDELDDKQKEIQKLFEVLNVKSTIAVSIFKNSKSEGILSACTLIEEKKWHKEEAELMKNTAYFIFWALSLINRCK